MAVVDPISDMLTRIRNGHQALHQNVIMPGSKMKLAIAGILKDEGYIKDFCETDNDLKIDLCYSKGRSLISGLKKISKPGRRVYVGAGEIPRVQNGLGICVVSTSSGVLAGEVAREKNVGGELLFKVW